MPVGYTCLSPKKHDKQLIVACSLNVTSHMTQKVLEL